ncbi:hypothetical protein U1Q18_029275 [Sarracenia purpurea var. burkii]
MIDAKGKSHLIRYQDAYAIEQEGVGLVEIDAAVGGAFWCGWLHSTSAALDAFYCCSYYYSLGGGAAPLGAGASSYVTGW